MIHSLIFLPAFFIAAAAMVDSPLELRLIVPEGTPGAIRQTMPTRKDADPEVLWCASEVLLNAASVNTAYVYQDPNKGWIIAIQFTEKGKKQLADATTRYKGRQIGILSHGRLLAAPVVQSPITGGKVEISGSFTEKDAHGLANAFNQGAAQKPQATAPLTPPISH